MNLLVVDWDYFCRYGDRDPQTGRVTKHWLLYDWGHREQPLFIHGLWTSRAAGFLRHDLPLPDTTGEERDFWERFTIRPGAKLYYGESNALAVHPRVTGARPRWDSVWLYDAHHDAGYNNETAEDVMKLLEASVWDCGNWMIYYHAVGAELHMRYPTWRSYALTLESTPAEGVDVDRRIDVPGSRVLTPIFDRVFVCRSGAWAPPWLDDKFTAFVDAAPIRARNRVCLDNDFHERAFSIDEAQRIVEMVMKCSEKGER